MIWWAVIYWLAINTMGVGVIVGSMCNCKKEKDILFSEKDSLSTGTEDDSHEEYSPDYFKNMVKENNTNAMNDILKEISNYFSTETSNSAYLISWNKYKKIPFSILSETFNAYGIKMFTLCNEDFTKEDYCRRLTIRIKITDAYDCIR